MMNRIQTYYLISNLLSCGTKPGKREALIRDLQLQDINWSLFLFMGSNHLVLQTVYYKILQENLADYFPSDVLEHLKYIYDLNYQRNLEIMQQVEDINRLLNGAGIIPMYLKGVGNILDGLYCNMGERLMHDIDILVPEKQWETAANILLQNEYKATAEYDFRKRLQMKHYPPLVKPGARASVEIHRIPINYKYADSLGLKEIWHDKKEVHAYGKSYVMSNKHKIIYNFVHSQLIHDGHIFARVHLRNLYDLFLLSVYENPELALSAMNNYYKQAAGYLRITQKAFGIEPIKFSVLKESGYVYATRYEINLRSRLVSLFTFLSTSMFRAYIKVPLQAFKDRELFFSLLGKIINKSWYRLHFKKYMRIYAKRVG